MGSVCGAEGPSGVSMGLRGSLWGFYGAEGPSGLNVWGWGGALSVGPRATGSPFSPTPEVPPSHLGGCRCHGGGPRRRSTAAASALRAPPPPLRVRLNGGGGAGRSARSSRWRPRPLPVFPFPLPVSPSQFLSLLRSEPDYFRSSCLTSGLSQPLPVGTAGCAQSAALTLYPRDSMVSPSPPPVKKNDPQRSPE